MAADAFIQCRMPQATKAALRAAAERRHVSESALLKRMLQPGLQATGTDESVDIGPSADHPLRSALLSVRLTPGDHLLLQARSAARCLPPATYASVLFRAHLRALTPVPEAELRAIRQSTRELAAIGRILNQMARAQHQGGAGAGNGREYLFPEYALSEAELDVHHRNAYSKLRQAALRVAAFEQSTGGFVAMVMEAQVLNA